MVLLSGRRMKLSDRKLKKWVEIPSIGHISFFIIFKMYLMLIIIILFMDRPYNYMIADVQSIILKICYVEMYYLLICYLYRPLYNIIIIIAKRLKK